MINFFRISLCLLMLTIGGVALLGTSYTSAQEETPDPSLERLLVEAFPRQLYCDDITDASPGPSWESITIGESTIEDLEAYLATISNTAGVFPNGNNAFIVGNIFTNPVGQRGPTIMYGCTIDNVITVLQVWYTTESLEDIRLLTDLMYQLGEPDAATYTPVQPSMAISFWFDEGIAAESFTGASETDLAPQLDNPIFGRTDVLTFFPYQEDIEGYEARWPYNRTYTFIAGAPEPIGTENPFDFENLQATVTGMPSPMPTPTFTPNAP